jgi:hypothetical protein
MRMLISIVLVAGCVLPAEKVLIDAGSDAGPDAEIDANVGPYRCLGTPNPTMAPPMITATGAIRNLLNQSGVPTATLNAFRTGVAVPLHTWMSDMTGSYSTMIPTGGMALDGYVRVTKTNFLDSYLYPPAPVAADIAFNILMTSSATLDAFGTQAGITIDPTKGHAFINIFDCDQRGIPDALLITSSDGVKRYLIGGLPSQSAMATDLSGLALIVNATPGVITINAMVGGMTLRAHDVQIRAATIVLTGVQP